MGTMRQLNVSIIGDSPFGVLGLQEMLGSIGVNVCTVHDRLEALLECELGEDAIIIDIYFSDEMQVIRRVKEWQIQTGGQFVIFSDVVWTHCDGLTFIRRSEQCDIMKKHLLQGVVGSKGGGSLPKCQPEVGPDDNVSHAEALVLKEWLRGRTVTQIARLSNRSTKTISAHKRRAMKKLMVRGDVELYWKLLKKGFVC